MAQSQRLNWTFTINNYVNEDGEEETMDDTICTYLIEAHEVGESGTPHIQGYCQLKVPMRLNQLKQVCPLAHFEVARGTPYQNFLYCAKGEQTHQEWIESKENGPNYGKNAQFLEWGPRPKAPINAHKKKPADTTYAEAIAATTIAEGMEIIKKRKARDYCLHGDAIERNLKKAKTGAKNYNSRFLETDFNIPLRDLSKASLFCGPTNIGKTQFALAHFKNPLLVCQPDDLKKLHPDHDGVVFDDMSFKHQPITSVIHMLDLDCERSIWARYGNATMPANLRRIFTFNGENPFYKDEEPDEQKAAVERRLQRYIFHNDIRKLSARQPIGPGPIDVAQTVPVSLRDGNLSQNLMDDLPVDDYMNEMNQVD